MMLETDVYEEIALDRNKEMPQGAHWSHCSVDRSPVRKGLSQKYLISA